jgi:hypothetical protein
VILLAEVEARLMQTRDRLVVALDAAGAGEAVDLSDLTQVVDKLCEDIVRLPPEDGRPLAEALALLIRGLDELEIRLKHLQARDTGRGDTGRAARAYRPPQG